MLHDQFSLGQFRLIKWSFSVHSITRNAPYVHPRLDSLLDMCRAFPNESSPSKTHEQRSVSMSSTGHRSRIHDSGQSWSRFPVEETSNRIQAMIKERIWHLEDQCQDHWIHKMTFCNYTLKCHLHLKDT